MARRVCLGSRTPSWRQAWCWRMRTSSGTSSGFVHPPKGCRRSSGLWNPCSSISLRCVSRISRAWPLWTGLRSWKANTTSACDAKKHDCEDCSNKIGRNTFKEWKLHPLFDIDLYYLTSGTRISGCKYMSMRLSINPLREVVLTATM